MKRQKNTNTTSRQSNDHVLLSLMHWDRIIQYEYPKNFLWLQRHSVYTQTKAKDVIYSFLYVYSHIMAWKKMVWATGNNVPFRRGKNTQTNEQTKILVSLSNMWITSQDLLVIGSKEKNIKCIHSIKNLYKLFPSLVCDFRGVI